MKRKVFIITSLLLLSLISLFFNFYGCALIKIYRASESVSIENKNGVDIIPIDTNQRHYVINGFLYNPITQQKKALKIFIDTKSAGSIDTKLIKEYGTYLCDFPFKGKDIIGGPLSQGIFTYNFFVNNINFFNVPSRTHNKY